MAHDNSEQLCPKCNENCYRDEVDVGVGVICGPWGCMCGWSSDPHFDASNGPSPAQLERGNAYYVDSLGGVTPVAAVADKLAKFGIPKAHIEDVFRVIPELAEQYDEDLGETPYHCQSCGHKDPEVEFWPSDGNPAPHVCPKCGSTNAFPVTQENNK